jgi:hypothetical protein
VTREDDGAASLDHTVARRRRSTTAQAAQLVVRGGSTLVERVPGCFDQ